MSLGKVLMAVIRIIEAIDKTEDEVKTTSLPTTVPLKFSRLVNYRKWLRRRRIYVGYPDI